MKIKFYDKPIPVTVELIDKSVVKAEALGTMEHSLVNTGPNKIIINFLVRLEDGSGLIVSQDQILSKDAEENLNGKSGLSRLWEFFNS